MAQHYAVCDSCAATGEMQAMGSTTGGTYWEAPKDWLKVAPAPMTTTLDFCSIACLIVWAQKQEK